MDFEIEDDSGDYTPYGRDPYSYKSSANSNGGSKKSGLFGGGGNDDEDAYDFQYDTEQDYGKRTSFHGSFGKASDPAPIPAFSPRPDQIKQHHQQPPRHNMSALDKAKEMLQKYNNKPTGGVSSSSQSTGNKYKTGRASLSFDEDELSAEDDDDEDESEDVGEYSISSPGTGLKNFVPKTQVGATVVPAKPITSTISSAKTNGNVNNINSVPTKQSTLNKPFYSSTYKATTIKELEESVEEEYEDDLEEEEESIAKSSHNSEDDDEEYENEEFDDLDEDVASDEKQAIKTKAGRSDSGGSDQDNASYSRMVYGNEEDEEEVSSESLEESKPKILSFADLADLSGWNDTPAAAAAPTNSKAIDLEKPATKVDSISPLLTKPALKESTAVQIIPSSKSITVTTSAINKFSGTTVSNNIPPPQQQKQSPPFIPLIPASNPIISGQSQSIQGNISVAASVAIEPTPAISPVTTNPTTSQPVTNAPITAPSMPNVPPSYPPYEYTPIGYPPYGSYPPAPPSSAPASTGLTPTIDPSSQPQYPHPAVPMYPYPYGSYPPPYSSPGAPPMPSHMMGYPYSPPVGFPYGGYPYPTMNPYQQLLAGMSMDMRGSLFNRSLGLNHPPMESETSQRVIMELLVEYNKAKSEAEWSKTKLAEMIVKMEQQQTQQQQQQQLAPQKAQSVAPSIQLQNVKAALTEEDTVDDSAAEYSMDFVEVSQLLGGTAPALDDPKTLKDSNLDIKFNGNILPIRTNSSWSPPKLRHIEPSLSHTLQGGKIPSSDRYAPNPTVSDSIFADNCFASAPAAGNKENEAPLRSSAVTLGNDSLTESVAKSFLASQELLRSKFEALRMKIQMSSSMHRSLHEFEELQFNRGQNNVNRSSMPSEVLSNAAHSPMVNSLDAFKQEAQRRKEDDARRLFALLREKYPELKPAEIMEMAQKFGSM